MRAKARSLSAPQEGKSKVALNCITRSDFIKDRVFHLPNSFNCRKGGNVIMGALTKQIQWLGYHRLLGSVFNHSEGSDCEHDLNLGPGAAVRPPVIGDDEYIILFKELNKLETAIMRQDRYVELFGEHRALLQVIRVVKRKYTTGCDVRSD